MSDTNQIQTSTEDWNEFMEEMNENVLDALERNVAAQTTFVEAWMDVLDGSTPEDTFEEGVQGYARAYEVWMDAAQEQFERMSDAIEGEEVEPEEFRDIWLNTANEAFKEVMSTNAFAAATGQTVQNLLEMRQDVDETAEETLHTLGFATEGDVEEIGERLVELERRQHDVEQSVGGVGQRLDAVEDRLVTLDDRIARFGENFDEIDRHFEGLDEDLDAVDARFDGVEEDLEDVGQWFEGFDEDFADVDQRLTDVEDTVGEVADRLDEFEERLDGFDDRFDRIDDRLETVADAVEGE